MLYTVGEMAKAMDIPASTLRYYHKEGLLPFVERSKGGIRMFSEADYSSLMIIDCLKKSGLSIKEIRAYMAMAKEGDSSLKDRLTMFQKRREAVKEQIRELERTLELLDYKCWYYETAAAAGTEAAVQHIPLEDIPEAFQAAKASMNPDSRLHPDAPGTAKE